MPTKGQSEQLKVQALAEDICKGVEMMKEYAAPIGKKIERRAVAFCTRYLGLVVCEFRADYVYLKKKEQPR